MDVILCITLQCGQLLDTEKKYLCSVFSLELSNIIFLGTSLYLSLHHSVSSFFLFLSKRPNQMAWITSTWGVVTVTITVTNEDNLKVGDDLKDEGDLKIKTTSKIKTTLWPLQKQYHLLTTCSQLAHDLFTTCSRLSHNLLTVFSLLGHHLLTTYLPLAHHLLTTCSKFAH